MDFALQGENQLSRVAVVMDVRGVRNSDQLEQALADLDAKKIDYEMRFVVAASTRSLSPTMFRSRKPSKRSAACCARCAAVPAM